MSLHQGHSAKPGSPSCGDASLALQEQCRASQSIAAFQDEHAQETALQLGHGLNWQAITPGVECHTCAHFHWIEASRKGLGECGKPLVMQVACFKRLPLLQGSRKTLVSGAGTLLRQRLLWTGRTSRFHLHSNGKYTTVVQASKSAEEGSMAPAEGRGYPLRPPRPVTTALVAFGLLQLYLFVINESLVPEGIRIVLYAIVKDKPNAQALAGLVTLVHVGEGLVALVTCLRRRYALVPTLYYTTLSFLLGFPGLGLTLKLDRINANRAAAKKE